MKTPCGEKKKMKGRKKKKKKGNETGVEYGRASESPAKDRKWEGENRGTGKGALKVKDYFSATAPRVQQWNPRRKREEEKKS